MRNGCRLSMSVSTVQFSGMNEDSKERRNWFGMFRFIFQTKRGHSSAAFTSATTLLQEESIYAAIIAQNTADSKYKITKSCESILKSQNKSVNCRK